MSLAAVTEQHARLAFWLFPRFVRWAPVRTLQHHLGGDLSLRQLTVLSFIRTADSTPGELACHLQVTPAVMTGIVDRLERNDDLRRVDDPVDRRRVRLVLTDEGRRVNHAVEDALVTEMASHLVNSTRKSWPSSGAVWRGSPH